MTAPLPHMGRLALFLLAALACGARPDDPEWAIKLARLPVPQVDARAEAVVLLDQTDVTVSENATATTVHRVVVRVLSHPGAKWAQGRASYLANEKVRSNEAWVIRDGKVVKNKSGSEWFDISVMGGGTIYTETRARHIDLSSETTKGDVFAFETRVEQPLLLASFQFTSGWSIPVVKETLQLCVPEGFGLRHETRRAAAVAPELSAGGRCLTWVLADQPYYPAESLSLGPDAMKPELFVTVTVPPGKRSFSAVGFGSWTEVARWAAQLGQGQCDSTAALTAKTNEITHNLATPLAKIQALSEYVQKLRYVSINRDLGKGAGYKPRKASEVFAQGYGDCKDKANLLRAMLAQAGIESCLAVVHLDESYEIYPSVPSPTQFNHAILAIRVDTSVNLPTVLEQGENRWLFFDVTDSHTQLGDLPLLLQGTSSLLIREQSDGLVTLPIVPHEIGHRSARKVVLSLVPGASGGVIGKVTIEGTGQPGARLRARLFQASAPKDFDDLLAGQLSETLRTSQLTEKSRQEDEATGRCSVAFGLENKRFLQFLPGGTAIARLDVLTREGIPAFPAKDRTSPVLLRPLLQDDEITLDIGDSFRVEELPTETTVETEYGRYERKFEQTGTRVVMKRRLQVNANRVPVAQYAKLRQFFSDVAKADRVSAVLKQTQP
jgi:hypothetical protein